MNTNYKIVKSMFSLFLEVILNFKASSNSFHNQARIPARASW